VEDRRNWTELVQEEDLERFDKQSPPTPGGHGHIRNDPQKGGIKMKKNYCFVILAVVAALFILSAKALAYTVTGNVNNPGEYSTDGSLWTVLQGSGSFGADSQHPYQYPCFSNPNLPCITLPQPPYAQNDINHNTVDSNYVLVTGKNGSRALYAVGELNPKFAPASAVVTLTCDKKGQCDLVGGGRTVDNVSNIEVVQAVPSIHCNNNYHPNAQIPFTHFYSSLIVISGAEITPRTYSLANLEVMKQETFDASSSTTNTKGIWTGPTLLSVLKSSGVDTRDMNSYVVVQTTDGYAAVLSMYEATHMTGAQYALLAITASDNSINKGGKDSGLARLVLPNDNVAGRWVSNVAQIVVYKLKACDDH